MESVKKLKTLQNISLNFAESGKITNQGVHSIIKALKKNRGPLKSLSLNLNECEKINKKCLERTGKDLQGLKYLQELRLEFGHPKKKIDKSLISFCQSLQKLAFLKSLFLNFEWSYKVRDSSLKILSHGLGKLASLSNLVLVFSGSMIKDEGLKYLCEALPKSLKSLDLDLSDRLCFTERGMKNLNQGLKRLVSLKKLSLGLLRCNISNNGLFTLCDKLNPSLEDLHLNLGYCQEFTEMGLKSVCGRLARLSSLQKINLNFLWCKFLSDVGLESLAQMLKALPLIKEVEVIFSNCAKITDEGVKKLTEGLKVSLKSLSLDFAGCWEISEKGLEHLSKCLKKMISLENLSLKFSKCVKISDVGMEKVSESLSESKCLKYLHLNFLRCKTTLQGRENAFVHLKGLKCLKDIEILVPGV